MRVASESKIGFFLFLHSANISVNAMLDMQAKVVQTIIFDFPAKHNFQKVKKSIIQIDGKHVSFAVLGKQAPRRS